MELRDYIEEGKLKFGTLDALAHELGMPRPNLSDAKAHRRGIPAYGIAKLSEILDIDPQVITAASELVTERNEAKRAYWLPFVTNPAELARHAIYALTLGFAVNAATPTPSEAAQNNNLRPGTVCIM